MKSWMHVSAAALIAAGALPAIAAAQEVGTVAAVNRDMTGTPPAADPRALNLGLGVFHDERVETSPEGSGQLMFLDQTTLTVAPNSNIILDEYVYDPAAGASDIGLSLTRGALRFIGGRITKDGPGTVRTPTATVGIRGGMAVLDIGDDGNTTVIHIAGESTTVSQCGDADGDGLDDRCAPQDARSQVVLSRPNATAVASGEGVAFTGLADSGQLAAIYGKLEGQGQGGLGAAPSEGAVQGGATQVASVNSGVPGGENNRPVSTTGEQAAPASGLAEQVTEPRTVVQNQTTTGGDPVEPDQPTGMLVPEGGAAFSPALGYVPFETVAAGSLIGSSGTETFVIPVPDSPDELLREHPDGAVFTPRAVALHPQAGLFPFGPDDASSTTLGPLRGEFGTTGIAFADFASEFVFVPFLTQDFDSGIVMFGTPTPGQGRLFPDDPGTPGAQTVDAYHNEAGLDLNRSFLFIGPGGRTPVPEQLYLVGKSGQPRFATDTATDPHAAAAPGRAVSAAFDTTGAGERLALFVAPLTTAADTPAEEMQISGRGFVTRNRNGQFSFGRPAYGTFEDAEGHTLFGPDGDYFVLSSVHRGQDGTLVTDDFGTDEVTLDPSAPGGTTTFDAPFRASMFTRDHTMAEVVGDPLPLAGETDGLSATPGLLDGGFATGIAICSTGNCGQPSGANGDFAGGYPLVTDAGPFGTNVQFQPDGTGVHFLFAMSDEGLGNISGAGADGDPDRFVIGVGPNGRSATIDASGAYLDDRRFAAVGNGPQVIAGNQQNATAGLASSGLAGTGALFGEGVDTQPEYLRWGYWSATWQVTDGTTGQPRTDLVPVGAFVAGNVPNPADLPFTGSARYDGFAVATAADLANGTTRTIGGSFSLDYDFGRRNGTFNLDLPDFAATPLTMGVQGQAENLAYTGATEGPMQAQVRGGFFAGGGDPVAATAGGFRIRDHVNNAGAVGVFGGDKSASSPGQTPGSLAAH